MMMFCEIVYVRQEVLWLSCVPGQQQLPEVVCVCVHACVHARACMCFHCNTHNPLESKADYKTRDCSLICLLRPSFWVTGKWMFIILSSLPLRVITFFQNNKLEKKKKAQFRCYFLWEGFSALLFPLGLKTHPICF